jgi:hypothetical protein
MLSVISLPKELTFVSEVPTSFPRRTYLYRNRKCATHLGGVELMERKDYRNVKMIGLLQFFLGK